MGENIPPGVKTGKGKCSKRETSAAPSDTPHAKGQPRGKTLFCPLLFVQLDRTGSPCPIRVFADPDLVTGRWPGHPPRRQETGPCIQADWGHQPGEPGPSGEESGSGSSRGTPLVGAKVGSGGPGENARPAGSRAGIQLANAFSHLGDGLSRLLAWRTRFPIAVRQTTTIRASIMAYSTAVGPSSVLGTRTSIIARSGIGRHLGLGSGGGEGRSRTRTGAPPGLARRRNYWSATTRQI